MANQTKIATEEINETLKLIENSSELIEHSIRTNSNEVEQGARYIQVVKDVLYAMSAETNDRTNGVEEMRDIIQNIAASSEQNVRVVEAVEDATKKMSDLTHQARYDTERSSLVIGTLSQAVSKFNIKK